MDIQEIWEKARAREIDGHVTFTTYRGTGHPDRADKAIHILRRGEFVVAVGERGKSGPALLKVEHEGDKSLRKLKNTAFFNLKNAGFERDKVEVTNGFFEQGWNLWEACFRGHHDRSLEAKRVFVRLCGYEVDSAFDGVAKKAGEVEKGRATEKAKVPYEGHPTFGLI